MKCPTYLMFLVAMGLWLVGTSIVLAADGPAIAPESYQLSHRQWLAPKWGDKTGRMLTDGATGSAKNAVIFKGPVMDVDFTLSGRHAVTHVRVHAMRGNKWYKLNGIQVFARQGGQFVLAAKNMGGWTANTRTSAHVYDFTDLGVQTDAIRLQVLTPNHCGLTEVEIFGTPVATAALTSGQAPPLPLSMGTALVARDDVIHADQRKVLLENRFVQLLIDPQAGGVVESVFHKPSRKQLSYRLPGSSTYPGGLCEDHNWDPYYSFAQFAYTVDLRAAADRAVVILTGKGREGIYRFMRIRKTLT
ncbi:MAG: hypothetical protein HON70_12490, partial [Lentisphaerae bacterium]|nr:hypothetical protein [Lentisphaerota bacterium]